MSQRTSITRGTTSVGSQQVREDSNPFRPLHCNGCARPALLYFGQTARKCIRKYLLLCLAPTGNSLEEGRYYLLVFVYALYDRGILALFRAKVKKYFKFFSDFFIFYASGAIREGDTMRP